MRKIAFVLALGAVMVLMGGVAPPPPVMADEEIPPLILDERPGMTIRQRDRDERRRDAEEDEDGERRASPRETADPSRVFIAIVNSHVLTREELDARIARRFKAYEEEFKEGQKELLRNFQTVFGKDSEAARLEILEDAKENIDNARRAEEGVAVREWVEHHLLADEARRQGIAVSSQEFRQRMEDLSQENQLDAKRVSAVLKDLRISESDYQKAIYDALLIERLIGQYIEANWTEEDLRNAYEESPGVFYTPERFLIAHFSISFDGSEYNAEVKRMEELARRVRNELRRGKDPEELFAEPDLDRIDRGIWGGTGYFTFQEGALPRPVETEARKLRVGQTSDVIVNRTRDGERVRPKSLHVIKVLDSVPATGHTFDSALPAIRRSLIEVARDGLIERLRAAGTHRMIINLGGIPPEVIPTREEILAASYRAQPINLRVREN